MQATAPSIFIERINGKKNVLKAYFTNWAVAKPPGHPQTKGLAGPSWKILIGWLILVKVLQALANAHPPFPWPWEIWGWLSVCWKTTSEGCSYPLRDKPHWQLLAHLLVPWKWPKTWQHPLSLHTHTHTHTHTPSIPAPTGLIKAYHNCTLHCVWLPPLGWGCQHTSHSQRERQLPIHVKVSVCVRVHPGTQGKGLRERGRQRGFVGKEERLDRYVDG